MKNWEHRTREEAYLFNPAFCCATLTSAINSYAGTGMSFSLAFLVLPIVLHKPTRDLLPRDTRTSLPVWLQENANMRILFFERVMSLKPHTREALQFGVISDWIRIQPSGLLISPLKSRHIDSNIKNLDSEARECVARARLVGKWLAAAGSESTVMALWGVRP